MVDKITVNPSEVRGAGDIVSPKTSSDFSFYNSYIQSSTQSVNDAPMTVYQMFKWGNYNLVLDFDKFVAYSEELTSFPVEVTLKDEYDRFLVGATLTCTVNGNVVLSEVTNSRGMVTFNVPVTHEGVYDCTVKFYVRTSTSGGVSGATKSFKVYVGVLNSILLRSSMNPLMTSDKSVLFCNVDYLVDNETLPAYGVKVNFYEEYVLDRIRMIGDNIVENGSVLPLQARVSDTDGSGIPSQPVKFFEEWDGGDLVFVNPAPIVQSGNVAEISVRLSDSDGSGISGETIMFYEEYTMGSLRLKLDKNLIETDVVTPVSASFRDIDGSLIQVPGTNVSFFEDYTISDVNLFGDKTIIIPGERVGFTARVTDGDGSPVPGETVMFYEEFTRTYLDVSMSTDTVVSDEESALSALVRDSDGSRVRNSVVEFTKDIDSTDWNVGFDEMTMTGTVEIGDEVPVSASVYDDNSNPVSDVYVRFVADMIPEETIIPDSDPEPEPPTVGSVVLVGDGNTVLSAYDSDTCNLTVTVKDTHNNVMEGESVVFKAGDNVLDTVETDSDGIARYTYHAVGSGDVSFTASVDNLVSETYTIEDLYAYRTSFSDFTSFTNKNTAFLFSPFILPTNHRIEFKLKSTNAVRIACGDTTHTNAGGWLEWIYAWYVDNKYLYYRNSNNSEASTTSSYTNDTTSTYAIEYNGTSLKLYKDGTELKSVTSYDTLTLTRYIRLNANSGTVADNLDWIKVKPIS